MAATDPLAEAFARHRQGDLPRAEKGYRAVLKKQPTNADALYLMGMLCLDRNRPGEAAKFLSRAIAALGGTGRPVDPGWRLALGTARQRDGDVAAALEAFEAALQAAPGNMDAQFCRATALQDLGRAQEAAAGYESVLKSAPNHADAANNLGAIRRDEGNTEAAIAAFKRAVAARPNFTEALCNLGYSLADADRVGEALPVLRAGAEARPEDEDLHIALFDCLVQANLAAEVETRAHAFLDRRPGSAPVMAALGGALEFLGRKEDAAAVFARAIACDPACGRAHLGLADVKGEAGRPQHIEAIRRAIARVDGPDMSESAPLWFALARHLGAAGEHADSFQAVIRANQVKGAGLAARNMAYKSHRMEREVDRAIAAFPPGSLDGAGVNDSEVPVFVLGMPRSGTTLTEQILASHPVVHGAGELGLIGQIDARIRHLSKGAPAPELLAEAAKFYLDSLSQMGGGAARVTDKMPGNFMQIGLILSMFPRARIIHCRRDAMDTCLSCFQQNFRSPGLAWSCDLADTAHFYCQYRRMMEHWRKVLQPGRMLEVDYEETVADLETQARRIIEFAGLPWDDACLDFHKADRPVITASHSQVRQKIYATSIGRWKRYGDAIQPLAKGLAACGCAPEED